MPSIFGRASYPGVNQVLSCNYSLVHGITPSVATLELVPQQGLIAAGGDLVIFDGQTTLTFRDCKVDSHSLRVDGGGFITSLSIFDRRWKFAFGSLSGTYNLRQENGDLDPARLKTPQQLAALALQAMGEQGFDVSEMPNNVFPLVEWDHENPAQALADLGQKVGCRVVLRLDGAIKVARTGVGQALPRPRQDILQDSLTIDPPERPDGITFVCAPTRFQVDFVLEAVGKDTDGKIRPIDDLSYTPDDGWTGEVPPFFGGVSDTPDPITRAVPRELAKETVLRWYRIKNEDLSGDQGIKIPGYEPRIQALKQMLPIEDVQVDTFVDTDGIKKSLPAEVSGFYYDGTLDFTNKANAPYMGEFTIDRELGVVQFALPLVQFVADEWEPAELILRCACSVRDFATWALVRFERTFLFPGQRFGTGNQQIRNDKIQLNIANNVLNDPVVRNQAEVIREADEQIAAAILAYQTPLPQSITYAGLKAISPDGAIQSVAWSVGPSGCTTQASRNDEFVVVPVPFEVRRLNERLQQNLLGQVQEALAAQRQQAGNKNRGQGVQVELRGRLLF